MSDKMNKYIDPLSDFGFKHLFGGEPNKDIMIEFLNALFKGQKHITDIVYSPTEYAGDDQEYRKVSFDLLCTGTQGEQFIVEMQRVSHSNFSDRCIFYLSRLVHQQKLLGKGNWNFKLKEVFLIAILDFKMKSSTNDHYLQSISLVNTGTGEIFHNGLGFKFLELPKFDKKEDELDKWVYMLKHMQSLGKIPGYLDKRIFQKIFNVAEMSRLTAEQRFIHDLDQQKKWEYQCILDETLQTGMERGEAKGLDKGMQHGIEEGIERGFKKGILEGIEKGIEQGLEQGKLEISIELAREMKKENFDTLKIVQFTKLPIEVINNL